MGASDPNEESATDRVTPTTSGDGASDDAAVVDGADRVDVVWFPGDDEYVVVAAGQGDRAVNFHRYGRVGVAAIAGLLSVLGIVVLHEFAVANTSLAWPVSGVVFAAGALAAAAYVRRRYDPDPVPEVVARDEPVATASDEYDLEE
jgi:hypothetical protein